MNGDFNICYHMHKGAGFNKGQERKGTVSAVLLINLKKLAHGTSFLSHAPKMT